MAQPSISIQYRYTAGNMYNFCIFKQNALSLLKIAKVMANNKTSLLPSQQRTLDVLGENIRLARLRRDLTAEQIAERAGIGRSTLVKVEKGDGGVAIGTYLKVLFVLGLDKDMLKLAEDDLLGRKLQDAKLTTKQRATKR